MKFLSARAGAAQSSMYSIALENGEQKRGNRSERHRANSPTLQEQTEVFLVYTISAKRSLHPSV